MSCDSQLASSGNVCPAAHGLGLPPPGGGGGCVPQPRPHLSFLPLDLELAVWHGRQFSSHCVDHLVTCVLSIFLVELP